MLFAAAIERLYDLNVGTTPLDEGAPHEKPHKPLLLLDSASEHRHAPSGELRHAWLKRTEITVMECTAP